MSNHTLAIFTGYNPIWNIPECYCQTDIIVWFGRWWAMTTTIGSTLTVLFLPWRLSLLLLLSSFRIFPSPFLLNCRRLDMVSFNFDEFTEIYSVVFKTWLVEWSTNPNYYIFCKMKWQMFCHLWPNQQNPNEFILLLEI